MFTRTRSHRKTRRKFAPAIAQLESRQLLAGVPGTVLIGPGRFADVVPFTVPTSGWYAIDFHGQQTSLSTQETIELSIPGVLDQAYTATQTWTSIANPSIVGVRTVQVVVS